MKPDLTVNIAGVSLKNPLVAASGCFGFGREYSDYFPLETFGALSVKGLTLRPRAGNPPPRIAESPSGCLNSVGLQNPGVEAFLRDELPFLQSKDIKIIANISAANPEEYGEIAAILSGSVALLEVNISCPNLNKDGVNFSNTPKSAALVTEAVKKHAKVPVSIKLSPNVTDITQIAKACKDAGCDAFSLINTLLGMRIDINTRRPILRMNIGGLSGSAIFPIAVRCVWQVWKATGLPIIGMGGVSSGLDVSEMLLAGASAVGIGSAIFQDPLAPVNILQEFTDWLISQKIARAADLTGSVETF